MTPQEFKAWFDGFTEAFDGKVPTKAQWGRVKERVAEIDGKQVTEHVYVHRYWPNYIASPAYAYPIWYSGGGIGMAQGSVTNTVAQNAGFNSATAMYALGKAEGTGMIGSGGAAHG